MQTLNDHLTKVLSADKPVEAASTPVNELLRCAMNTRESHSVSAASAREPLAWVYDVDFRGNTRFHTSRPREHLGVHGKRVRLQQFSLENGQRRADAVLSLHEIAASHASATARKLFTVLDRGNNVRDREIAHFNTSIMAARC